MDGQEFIIMSVMVMAIGIAIGFALAAFVFRKGDEG